MKQPDLERLDEETVRVVETGEELSVVEVRRRGWCAPKKVEPPAPPTGATNKKAAMTRVDANADPRWKDRADAAIVMVAAKMAEFSTADVWKLLDRPTEPRALGPRLTLAAEIGIIERTDRDRNSSDPKQNARPLRLWRSLIFKGPACASAT